MRLKLYEKVNNNVWIVSAILSAILLGVSIGNESIVLVLVTVIFALISAWLYSIKDNLLAYEIVCDKFEVIKEKKKWTKKK